MHSFVDIPFFIETYGCSFNTSDAETMSAALAQAGAVQVPTPREAHVIVVNSCTVKDRTTLELRKRLRVLRDLPHRPLVVLAGCAPRVPSQAREFAEFAMLCPDSPERLPQLVAQALREQENHAPAPAFLERGGNFEKRVALPHIRMNPAIEIVPIAQGCLGSCSYCQTVVARGRLRSASVEAIVRRVAEALDQGVGMVWLTAQDCGAYGLDIDASLPQLLRAVAQCVDAAGSAARVRVGMANPDHLSPMIEEFADALAHPCFFRFAHVPVQCGSDRVLQLMRRPYTVDEFRRQVGVLRSVMPDISIATDIIVGFPGETDDEFEQTIALMNELTPAVINRSRFSPRPHTAAARMVQLPSKVIAVRSQRLARLHEKIVARDLGVLVGQTLRVTVEQGTLARTDSYRPVALRGEQIVAGTQLQARMTGVSRFHLVGEKLERES